MRDTTSQLGPIVFGAFLERLKATGFNIGVDDYLRVQQLLGRPDLLSGTAELKLLLCPLLATSEKQQKQFYETFEAFFTVPPDAGNQPEHVDQPTDTASTFEVAPLPVRKNKWPVYFMAATGLVLFVTLVRLVWPPPPAAITYTSPPVTAPAPPPTPRIETETIVHTIGQPDERVWENRVVKREPIPLPPKPVDENESLRQNWKWLTLAITAIPLLAVGLLSLQRRVKRRRLESRQRDKRPPFAWPLTAPKTTQRLHEVEAFNTATRALRRRQQGESQRMDIEATISETIAHSGFPTLKFRPVSKVPEYLILIDRATLADHQARFFDDFTARLKKEDVFVESYFYDGDPRVCYRGDYRSGVSLQDLSRHGHRILIYGDGARLLEPDSGELAEWGEWFAEWDDRALLTPVAPAQWGRRERKLSELFLVLPATLEGLREALGHFESRNRPDLRAWRQRGSDNKLPVFDYDSSAEKTADKLRDYLDDDDLFQWVCACAAYPNLQWDLTLCLGEQVMPGAELWEKDILRLARLPWFRQGVMPEELRHCLLRRLEPENRRKVGSKLAELLQQTEKGLSEKFDNSWAKESLNLQIEIQQWLANPSGERASALRRKFRELPPSLTARDYATLLEVDAEPLSSRAKSLLRGLPESWRKHIWPHGLPPLGMKSTTLLALASPLALLLTISGTLFEPPAQITFVEQKPTEEYVTIVRASVTPSLTPTSSPIVSPNGELRLAFDRSIPGSIDFLITVSDSNNSGKESSFEVGGVGSAVTLQLPAGRYRSINITEIRRVGEPQPSGIVCPNNVQVSSGKITEVACRVPNRYQVPPVDCFSQNVQIIIAERNVPPNANVPLAANVQGGQNYGNLSFLWESSAGRINSSVNPAGIARLDLTGVAPGTIYLRLRVTSSLGNCSATAESNITIIPPTPSPTPPPPLMPNLVGQNFLAARRTVESLGGDRVITTVPLTDQKSEPNVVVRQEPSAGAELRPNERVNLYFAQAPPPRICYQIRINRIQVDDNGSAGAARWSFDISAGGTKVISLPQRNYYEDHKPSDGSKKKSFLPQSSSSPRQSAAQDGTASGSWCITEGQSFSISVAGTRDGEKEPEKAFARGERTVTALPQSFSVTVRANTVRQSEGSFTFYFIIIPISPQERK